MVEQNVNNLTAKCNEPTDETHNLVTDTITARAQLIRSSTQFEVSLKSLPDSYHFMFKCTVNSNMVNSKFH